MRHDWGLKQPYGGVTIGLGSWDKAGGAGAGLGEAEKIKVGLGSGAGGAGIGLGKLGEK